MTRRLLALLPVCLAAACAAPGNTLPTASGRPEGLFVGQDVGQVAQRLAETCASRGFVPVVGPATVTCSKSTLDMPGQTVEAAIMQSMLGSARSTPVMIRVTFSLWTVERGTRVRVDQLAETTSPFGQVNQAPIVNSTQDARLQEFLRQLGAV